jgi:nucleotide-binding universal stress UspA family protein
MGSLFFWMFRVPPATPLPVVTARRSVAAIHRILVPTVEAMASERAVELACRLGEAQKAEIILVYVVEVPLTLSLDTAMPDQETKGREALNTAEFIVKQHGLPVHSRMMHQRYAADGIIQLAKEEEVDAIVIGVGLKRRATPGSIGRTTSEVMRRAPCEVIIDQAPIPT